LAEAKVQATQAKVSPVPGSSQMGRKAGHSIMRSGNPEPASSRLDSLHRPKPKPAVVDLTQNENSAADSGVRQVVKDSHGTVVLTGTENRIDNANRARIQAFLGGVRKHVKEGAASEEVLLHQETTTAPNGHRQSVELVFEMNLDSGKWRKIKRVEDLGRLEIIRVD
jgi:hypothetical protein